MYHRNIIGIDTHTKSNSLFALDRESGEVRRVRTDGKPESVARCIKAFGLEGTLEAVYESGPTGFTLARYLEGEGIPCVIAATSKMPHDNSRVKNDRRDAEALARLEAAGTLHHIYIPTPLQESRCDLSHHIFQVSRELTCARQRVDMFLVKRGISYKPGAKRWTKTHIRWLNALDFANPLDAYTLHSKVSEVEHLQTIKDGLTAKLAEVVAQSSEDVRAGVGRLMAVYGIGLTTAFAFVSEVYDYTRFKNGAAFASFLGITPSEDSTGTHHVTGAITKQGNAHLRRLALEVVGVPRIPSGHRTFPPCAIIPAPDVVAMAERANRRIEKRRAHLKGRGKSANKTKVALARELTSWIYYLMVA
jgi:transposase